MEHSAGTIFVRHAQMVGMLRSPVNISLMGEQLLFLTNNVG